MTTNHAGKPSNHHRPRLTRTAGRVKRMTSPRSMRVENVAMVPGSILAARTRNGEEPKPISEKLEPRKGCATLSTWGIPTMNDKACYFSAVWAVGSLIQRSAPVRLMTLPLPAVHVGRERGHGLPRACCTVRAWLLSFCTTEHSYAIGED